MNDKDIERRSYSTGSPKWDKQNNPSPPRPQQQPPAPTPAPPPKPAKTN